MTLRFDQVIPLVLDTLDTFFESKRVETTLVRDVFGAICVILPDEAITDPAGWKELALRLHEALGVYSPGDNQVLLRVSDLIDASDIIDSPDRIHLPEASDTWLVDRLQTNQDWIRTPLITETSLPIAVAFSIKGGVGRTTAFVLWAWYLARMGKNVVLVDLDMEAPGIAGLLLDEEHLPDYGLVDWLVESFVGQANSELLRECLIECSLSQGEPGQIRVLPAWGSKTREYVSKLGRIYMPTFVHSTGELLGFAERVALLLRQLAELPDLPDVILLDARAGLHDIGSAAVTRLGAEVFLFVRDDYQTWQAYQQLFEHLRQSRNVAPGMDDNDLRWRLRMVGSQLEPTESSKRRLLDACYNLWTELYDDESSFEEGSSESQPIPVVFERDDFDAPHFPFSIQFDPRIRGFDLLHSDERPDWRIIETAFGEFFSEATRRLFPDSEERGAP